MWPVVLLRQHQTNIRTEHLDLGDIDASTQLVFCCPPAGHASGQHIVAVSMQQGV